MGITSQSIARLRKFNCLEPLKMCELGAQNIYEHGNLYGSVAKHYFQSFGVDHTSYDISVHQECEFLDLREPIDTSLIGVYDVITDFGTTEHIDSNYYQANKNIHDMCKVGGLIIKENPCTGHWIGHGYNYVDEQFYKDLSEANGYEILDLCIESAMGNTIDGNNVCVVFRKTTDQKFMTKTNFSKLKFYNS